MSPNDSGSAGKLRKYLDAIIAAEKEKADISFKIACIYEGAVAEGFSRAAMKRIVREHFETPEARAKRKEAEAIAELYAATVGSLHGAPLSDEARKRMSGMQKEDTDDVAPAAEEAADDGVDPDLIKPAEQPPQETVEQARQRGRDDALAGRKVLENPYVAGDPRRAAWDEGWCESAGSDGMDIPEAWRPSKKPKKADEPEATPDEDDEPAAEADEDEQEG